MTIGAIFRLIMGNSTLVEFATWHNGNKYEGEFKDWVWHGHGKLSISGGQYLIGEFKRF